MIFFFFAEVANRRWALLLTATQDSDVIWVKLIHSDVKDTAVILHNHQKEQKAIYSIAFLGSGCQSLSDE